MNNFKKYFLFLLAILLIFLSSKLTLANNNISNKLPGNIVLQVESLGEAWYINPANELRYYLGRPGDAFEVMRKLGNGITNNDLIKIPAGLVEYDDNDDDDDGLTNRLEDALGTDSKIKDSDSDGHDDFTEIKNGYDPLSPEPLPLDLDFRTKQSGKIFIQVEKNGEAWYVNPNDLKRYYLGRPADAFLIMRKFGLGISNENINEIPTGTLYNPPVTPVEPPIPPTPACTNCSASQSMAGAAKAIRSDNKSEVIKFFSPAMKNSIEYTMDFLDSEGKLTLGNILSGATLTESTDNKKTFSTDIYFSMGGYKVPVDFFVEKQNDGTWLIANL